MLNFPRLLIGLISSALTLSLAGSIGVADEPSGRLELRHGDRICLLGNATGERMQHQNWFETLLYQRHPDLDLVVRNLCFPGDEVKTRLRSFNFGTPEEHLSHSRASVVICFFGYNESFAGNSGLERFSAELDEFVKNTLAADYSGAGAPRIVLVSPTPVESAPAGGDSVLEINARLLNYSKQMEAVALKNGALYVDVFRPLQSAITESDDVLTSNGFHLNASGYQILARTLTTAIFGVGESLDIDKSLRAAIADKNFHWWHRYRAVNGFSIYGKRNLAGFDGTYRNVDVMEREREILDQMVTNRDRRIWKKIKGEEVAETIDDSNTLPFLMPRSNVKGSAENGMPEYLSAEETRQRFQVPEGFVVDLIACEEDIPELVNPVAINFDSDGRLWVATMPSYPQWKPKTPLNDKLLILTERDENGRYYSSQTFADGLHQPTGFELGHGGVFVAQQPDILLLHDEDGNDVADSRQRRLIGFDTADSHHGIAAFEWGPGGGLYFQEGTFKQSQVETPHGVERLSDAGVWRYDPRTEDFRVHVSVPFANPWGHVFDQWGQGFIADASDGLNYWSSPFSGRIEHPAKHPGGWIANKGWDKLPLIVPRKRRPSSGCELVSSRQFPASMQGNYLVNNVIGFQGVLQHSLRDDGAGYQGEEIEHLLKCEDANFRPVDLQFGPDGALYIVDWHNALIGHLQHNLRDPNRDRSHGRIWRVRYAKQDLLASRPLSELSVSELLAELRLPELRTRYRVRRELAGRPSHEVLNSLASWLKEIQSTEPNNVEQALLEALWLNQAHDSPDRDLLVRLLNAKRFEVRAAAVRVLSYWLERIDEPFSLLRARISDEHPRVRLEAVRACSFVSDRARATEIVIDVLALEMDPWLQYTLDETMRALE